MDGIELAPVTYSYDTLGRLSSKTFGYADDNGYGTESFTYDIHGWATAINTLYNGSTLFQEALRYASTQKPGTTARWNGNISEAAFTDPDDAHTYAYTYDGMSRLTDAAHFAGQSNITSNAFTERSLSYDRNGNITALQRYDENGIGTTLSFALAGNRIASNTYDAMGNMTRDSRTGLQFSYNIAKLPKVVRRADGETLTYTYLADGTKWSAAPSTGSSLKYHGSFVYEDDGSTLRPSSVAWDEGRISYHYAPDVVDSLVVEFGEELVVDSLEVVGVVDSLFVEDGICDEWHVRDHLGSVRAVVGIGNYITGIRELNTYLPFGTRIPGSIQAADNRHRFSSKEEQRYGTFNIGLSDFGARYYDPFTCRWTTRDPLAGKYLNLSPYNYCAGNPVNVIDPLGKEIRVSAEYQEQFLEDIEAVFGDKVSSFSFNNDGVLQLNGRSKEFIKDLSIDQKRLFKGLNKAMNDRQVTNVVYADELSITVNGEGKVMNIVKDFGGGVYSKVDNLIVVSPNAGSVEVTMDIPDFSNGFSFPTTIVQQNTTSVLFHEIGERNTTNISYRGSVIDYENSARRLIKLPLRPYDLNHSNTIKTNYNK